MKVYKLKDFALIWAVALCEGYTLGMRGSHQVFEKHDSCLQIKHYQPTTDWNQGGVIIDREGIEFVLQDEEPDIWWAKGGRCPQSELYRKAGAYGETHLIAAMRFYVMSKMGEDIDVPDEVLGV